MRMSTLIPFRYVELYPEYRPHYRPFGFGYGIYVRVSILYTKSGIKVPRNVTLLEKGTLGGVRLKPRRMLHRVNGN